MDRQPIRLGAPDTRLWERSNRTSRQGRYQPVGPRARMTRGEGFDPVPHGGPCNGQCSWQRSTRTRRT